MRPRLFFMPVLVSLTLILQATPAAVSQQYPTRKIRLIVPLPPGGTLDIFARLVGAKLADRLGKPVIVENQPGAGTVVGTGQAARAAADGYTVLVTGTAALAVNPTLIKKLPYDPVKDFEPVALVLRIPLVLVVNPSLPVHSLSDLIKLAKKEPGQLFYGSAGFGTQPHLAAELLMAMAGIEMIHAPYKGAAAGLRDVMPGRIQLIFADSASALPLIRASKVRALGVTSLARMTSAPDIPPIAEAGLPGFKAVPWIMIVVPANTPQEIVKKLHSEFKSILALADVQQRIVSLGAIPVDSPPPFELRRFLKSEMARWGQIVQQRGLAGSH